MKWFELDLRSLGLLRIALGLVLIVDILSRLLNFRAHYTAAGVLPLKLYMLQPDISYRLWSVFYLSDAPLLVGSLFLASLAAAVAFTLGWRTRWTGWICWIFLVSIQHRNPMVMNAGDRYLTLLFFWGNLLPWGEAFSLDGGADGAEPRDASHRSLAGVAYLLQVCYVYWFSSVLRVTPEWRVDGTTLYYALSFETLRTNFGAWLLGIGPEALAFFTFASLLLEEFGPLLLLVPWAPARVAGVVFLSVFHFGIALTLAIGIFSITGMVAPLGLLPATVWESRAGKAAETSLRTSFQRVRERLPSRLRRTPGQGRSAAVAIRIVAPLALSLTTFHLLWGIHHADQKTVLTDLARVLSLDQRWGVFTAQPVVSSWDSAPAVTSRGRRIDLLTGQAYRFPRGEMSARGGNRRARWIVFESKLTHAESDHAEVYLQYLVRRWNDRNPDDPVRVAEYRIHPRRTAPNYLLGEEGTRRLAGYKR